MIIILPQHHDNHTMKTFYYYEPDIITNTVVVIKVIAQNIPFCYLNQKFHALHSQRQYL